MMNSSRTVFFTVVWMSTKCFHVRHLMSLIAMLIEEIRYFDKKQTKLPLIDNSKSIGYELCYCHNLPFFPR